jgi:hypothetical protein
MLDWHRTWVLTVVGIDCPQWDSILGCPILAPDSSEYSIFFQIKRSSKKKSRTKRLEFNVANILVGIKTTETQGPVINIGSNEYIGSIQTTTFKSVP